jgi:hypothetical protein
MNIGFPTERVTISRNDELYECFPDIALLRDGSLVCVYRESDGHTAHDFTTLVWRVSTDNGVTWGDRNILVESVRAPGHDLLKWNCPRVGELSDGRVYILCDHFPVDEGHEDFGSTTFIWWRNDNGSWDDPHNTCIPGIMPDRICELPSGRMLLATQWRSSVTSHLAQTVAHSDDGGATWSERITIAASNHLDLCEASIIRLPLGELVCYMRENSMIGLPAYKSISHDDGATWSEIAPTLMAGGHRLVAGFLPSGHIMVTYRQTIGGTGPISQNLFAYREPIESALELDPKKQTGVILPVDHDRNPMRDGGYTGWVTLPDGRVFIANYIVDDAPNAQIRGYWLTEDLFELPE